MSSILAGLRHVSSRLSRPRVLLLTTLIPFLLLVAYLSTPYDSSFRAFFRFHRNTVQGHLGGRHGWITSAARYPTDIERDVGVIIKTGYGTRQRVPKLLAALADKSFVADMVIVQDYPVGLEAGYAWPDGDAVPTIDAIGWLIENDLLKQQGHSERLSKYHSVVEAIQSEDWGHAEELARSVGWELDAMKFIPALQYIWKTLPHKKWYLILDDDTYVIRDSLRLLLDNLDPTRAWYLGNPVGDYKARFAHGGSSIILSHATMSLLFEHSPTVVDDAVQESATTIWGDKLLATTLMKVGVYLDESYSLLFNGEPPRMTRMWINRFCLPLLSFHSLGPGNGEAMDELSYALKTVEGPILWRQLGHIYGGEDFDAFEDEPFRPDSNYVGRIDEHGTRSDDVPSYLACYEKCLGGSNCLAWAWEEKTGTCFTAPWIVVGPKTSPGFFSGINAELAKRTAQKCDL